MQVNGAKTLVLDPTLAGPLGLVTEVLLLKVRIHCSYKRPRSRLTVRQASWCGQDVLARAGAIVRDLHQHRVPLPAAHQVG